MRRGFLQLLPDGPLVPITGELRVGRGQQCELRVDSKTLAREHTLVCVRDGAYWVRDLGSPCGTFLERGGAPACRRDQVQLEDGDVFISGHCRIKFTLEPQG